MFFSAYRRAIRKQRELAADRDFWKTRALELEKKLEKRSDFFIEREFRLVDRFLTSEKKTYAITDEIRQKEKDLTMQDADNAALDAFLDEKKDAMIRWAREAGIPHPVETATNDFERQRALFTLEFEQGMEK